MPIAYRHAQAIRRRIMFPPNKHTKYKDDVHINTKRQIPLYCASVFLFQFLAKRHVGENMLLKMMKCFVF